LVTDAHGSVTSGPADATTPSRSTTATAAVVAGQVATISRASTAHTLVGGNARLHDRHNFPEVVALRRRETTTSRKL
jgi:hypothetical protein